MAKRLYDKGSLYGVAFGESEISKFRDKRSARGPGGLRNLYAEFDKRTGYLVDFKTNGRSGAGRFDGEALDALIGDMQEWGDARRFTLRPSERRLQRQDAGSAAHATKSRIAVRKSGSRWQPVDSAGNVVRGNVYNADGTGYSTKEGAAEAAQMLRVSRGSRT